MPNNSGTLFSDIKFRTAALSIVDHLFFKQESKDTLEKAIKDRYRNHIDFLSGIKLNDIYRQDNSIFIPYRNSLIQIKLTKSSESDKTDLTKNIYKGYNIVLSPVFQKDDHVVSTESVTIDYTNVTSDAIKIGGLTNDDLEKETRILTSNTIQKQVEDSIKNGFLSWPNEILANTEQIEKIIKKWKKYQDFIVLGAPRLAEAVVNYQGVNIKNRRIHFVDTLEGERFVAMKDLPDFDWNKTCVVIVSQGAGDMIQQSNFKWLKDKINGTSRIAVIADKNNRLYQETESKNCLTTIDFKNNENVMNFSGSALALTLGLAGIDYKKFAKHIKTVISRNMDDLKNSAAGRFASIIRALGAKKNHKGELVDTIMMLCYDKAGQSVIDAAVSSGNARLSSTRTYIGSNAPEANHQDYQIAMGKNGTLMVLISPEKWMSNQIIPATAKPRWRSTPEAGTYTTAQFMDVSKKGIKADLTEFNDHNIDITFTQDLNGITKLIGLFQLSGELDYLAIKEKDNSAKLLNEFDNSFTQMLNKPTLPIEKDSTLIATMADGNSSIDISGLIGIEKSCLNKDELSEVLRKVEQSMSLIKTGHDVEGKHIYLDEPREAMSKNEITDSRKMASLLASGKKNIIFLGIGAPHHTIKFGTQPFLSGVQKVFFGGNTLDPREIDKLIKIVDEDPDGTLIVYTSYSGETAEPDIVFRILLDKLTKKAGAMFSEKAAINKFMYDHILIITGKRGSLSVETTAAGFRKAYHPLSSGRHAIFTTTVYGMELLGLQSDVFIKSGCKYIDKIFTMDEKLPLIKRDPGFFAGALTGYVSGIKNRPKIKIVDFTERLANAGVWRDKHMLNESLNKPYIATIAKDMEVTEFINSFSSLTKDTKSIYVLFSDKNDSDPLMAQREAFLKASEAFLRKHGIPFIIFQIDASLRETSHANLILAWEQFVLGFGCTIADAPHGYSVDDHVYGQEKCEKARIAVDKACDDDRGRKQAAIDDVIEQFILKDEALIRTAETAVHIGQRYFDNIKGKNLLTYWARPNAQAERLVADTIECVKDAIKNGNIKQEDIRAVITIHPITRIPIVNEKDFSKQGKFIVCAMPADNLIEGFNPLSSGGNPGSIIVISESENSFSFNNTKMIMEFIHGPGDEPGVMVWAKNEMLGRPAVYSYAKIDGVLVPRVVLKAGSHLTNIPEKRGSDSFTITDSQTSLPPAIVSLWDNARESGIRSRNFRNPVSNIAKLINGGITEFTTTWFEAYIHAMFAEGMGGKVNIITKDGKVYDNYILFTRSILIDDSEAFQKVIFTAGDPEWMQDLKKILQEESPKPKNLPDPLWVPDEPEFKPEDKPKLVDFLKKNNTNPSLIKIVDLWTRASIDFGNEYKKITMLKPIGTANIASEIQYLADIKADEIYHEIFARNHDLIHVSVSEERAVTHYDKEALFASYCDPVDGVKNLLQGFVTGNIEAITFKDGSGGISMHLLQGANILIFSDDSGTYSAIWDGKDFRVLYEYEYADPVPWAVSNIAIGGADSKYLNTHPQIDSLINYLLENGYVSDNAYGMLIDTARILDRSRERIFRHKLSSLDKNSGVYKLEPLKKEIRGGLLRSGGYIYADMEGAKSRPEIADLGGKMRLTELIAQCKEINKVKRSKTGKGLGWHFGTNKSLDRIVVAYNDENLPQLSYPCFLGVDDGLLSQINKIMWAHYVEYGFASRLQAVTTFEKYDVLEDPDYEEALDIDSESRVFRLKKNRHMGMVRIQQQDGWRSYPVHGRIECLDIEAIFENETADLEMLKLTAEEIRARILQMIYTAGSGHIGSSLGCADILTALYFGGVMRYDPQNVNWPDRDRLVLSAGHVVPAQYAALSLLGILYDEELKTLRKPATRLPGHPDPLLTPGVDMGSGSLGQGLAKGSGIALAAKMDGKDYQTYVLLGDGELQEGQVSEAIRMAPVLGLDNLTAIVNYNGLQIDGLIQRVDKRDPIQDWENAGWHVITVNGNDIAELLSAFEQAKHTKTKPTVIIAATTMGKGISFMEKDSQKGDSKWHSLVPNKKQYEHAIREIEQRITKFDPKLK